jgi:hypothetical protein
LDLWVHAEECLNVATEIQLAELTQGQMRTLSGQDLGVEARDRFDLDALDAGAEPVLVRVPDDLDSVTPSFVQGMFSKSVKHFASRDKFLQHYVFVAGPVVLRQIDDVIRDCLVQGDDLSAWRAGKDGGWNCRWTSARW